MGRFLSLPSMEGFMSGVSKVQNSQSAQELAKVQQEAQATGGAPKKAHKPQAAPPPPAAPEPAHLGSHVNVKA